MILKPLSLNFRLFTVKLVGVRKFRNFTVIGHTLTSVNTQYQILAIDKVNARNYKCISEI